MLSDNRKILESPAFGFEVSFSSAESMEELVDRPWA